jgi:hypothetical protein
LVLGKRGLQFTFAHVKTIEITVEHDGVLRLPPGIHLPAQARLAVLVLDPAEFNTGETSSETIAALAEQSGAFDFLKEEPEIYGDGDILPGRRNPRFWK